jgi:hypothetical protein
VALCPHITQEKEGIRQQPDPFCLFHSDNKLSRLNCSRSFAFTVTRPACEPLTPESEDIMADIFLSYASKDRAKVEPIVKALREKGWSVWWDRKIPPGMTWVEMIAKALKEAKCVLVLWSQHSLNSEWVLEEATIGKRRKIVVPARIDSVDPPLGFGLMQAADLIGWDSNPDHAGFSALTEAIARIVPPSTERTAARQVARPAKPRAASPAGAKTGELKSTRPKTLRQKPATTDGPSRHDDLTEKPSDEKKPQPKRDAGVDDAADRTGLFSKPSPTALAVFIIIGMLTPLVYSNDYVRINFTIIQVFLAFLSGYIYGSRAGLLTGALIFLPNLIAFFVLSPAMSEEQPIFGEQISLFSTVGINSLSIISYPIFACLGFCAALLRDQMHRSEKQFPFVNACEKISGQRAYWFLVPLCLNALSFKATDNLAIYFSTFTVPLLLVASFYHGGSAAIKIFACFCPLMIVQVNFGPLSVGTDVDEAFAFWALAGIVLAGSLDSRAEKTAEFRRLWLYLLLLAVSVLLSFKNYHRNFVITGYPVAFAVMLAAGALFGSRRGFWFGIYWAVLSGIVQFWPTERWAFGSVDQMARLAAPFIGYLGGSSLFKRGFLSAHLIRLFGIVYAACLASLLIGGTTHIGAYSILLLNYLLSVLSAFMLCGLLGNSEKLATSPELVNGGNDALSRTSSKVVWVTSIVPVALILLAIIVAVIAEM